MRMPGRSKWEEPEDELPEEPMLFCCLHRWWYRGYECPLCVEEIENHLLTLEEGDA